MTLVAIASLLGVSIATAHKFKVRGMPMDRGIDAARAWLEANRRPGGRPRGYSPKARQRIATPGLVPIPPQPQNAPMGNVERLAAIPALGLISGSTPEQLLDRCEQVERAAFAAFGQAMRTDPAGAQLILRVHNEALRNLLVTRSLCLAAAEREKSLVSGAWVRSQMVEHDGLLANLVRAMPRQMAPRVNPHGIEHAERELNSWVQNQFLKTLHATTSEISS